MWIWGLLGVLVFLALPWYGLEYGLTRSTPDEFLAAYAWQGWNLAALPLVSLVLLTLRPWRALYAAQAQWTDVAVAAGTLGGLAVGAFFSAAPLGLGAALHALLLALFLVRALAARGFVQGDPFTLGAITLIVSVVGLFVFFPVGKIVAQVLHTRAGDWAPLQFFSIVTSFGVGRVLRNTLYMAVCVGLSTTFFGLVFALYTVRGRSRLKSLFGLFYILPIITPPFVVGLSLILLFGRAGSVSDLLVTLLGRGGLLVPEGHPGWFVRAGYIYGFPGIFLAQTLAFTPVTYMMLVGMVSSINPAVEEASATMRATHWQTFRHVTFPLIRPGIANAFMLSVISSIADFGNPLVLGGEYDVLSTEIYFSAAGSRLDYSRAAALGILLLVISLSAFLFQHWWIGRKSYVTVTGSGGAGNVLGMPAWMERGIGFIVVLWMVVTGALYGSVFLGGFVLQWGADYTFTLKHHLALWGQGLHRGGWPSFFNALMYSAVAAPLTAAMGILLAYITTRKRFAGRTLVNFGSTLVFAIPGTVIGIAYIMAFNTAPILLTGSVAILIISMVIRAMPVGVRAGVSALAQIDRSLEEASLLQRAGTFTTLRRVVLPLIRPALITATAYSFIRAMTTVSAVIFLATPGTNVATIYMLARVEDGDYGVAIAYGSVLIASMVLVVLLIQAFVGQSRVQRTRTLA